MPVAITIPEIDRHCRNCRYFLWTAAEKGMCQAEPQSVEKMEGETCGQFSMTDEYYEDWKTGIVYG